VTTAVKRKVTVPEWADNEVPRASVKPRFNSKGRLKRETVLVTLRSSGGKVRFMSMLISRAVVCVFLLLTAALLPRWLSQDPIVARGLMHLALATAKVVYDDVFQRWLAHFPVLVDLLSDSSHIGA